MTIISKKDFVEIEYTGKTKDENFVFDTTDEKVAKEHNLQNQNNFGPVIVCIGEEQVLKGIDWGLEGKETGKEYDLELSPADAFGSKNAKLIHLVPTNKFKQQNLQPMPGMQVNIDGVLAIIRTVSGGRVLVDFNHPLASKNLLYEIKITGIVTDDKKKIASYFKIQLGFKEPKVEINETVAKITLATQLPKEIEAHVTEKLLKIVPSVKKLEFVTEKK